MPSGTFFSDDSSIITLVELSTHPGLKQPLLALDQATQILNQNEGWLPYCTESHLNLLEKWSLAWLSTAVAGLTRWSVSSNHNNATQASEPLEIIELLSSKLPYISRIIDLCETISSSASRLILIRLGLVGWVGYLGTASTNPEWHTYFQLSQRWQSDQVYIHPLFYSILQSVIQIRIQSHRDAISWIDFLTCLFLGHPHRPNEFVQSNHAIQFFHFWQHLSRHTFSTTSISTRPTGKVESSYGRESILRDINTLRPGAQKSPLVLMYLALSGLELEAPLHRSYKLMISWCIDVIEELDAGIVDLSRPCSVSIESVVYVVTLWTQRKDIKLLIKSAHIVHALHRMLSTMLFTSLYGLKINLSAPVDELSSIWTSRLSSIANLWCNTVFGPLSIAERDEQGLLSVFSLVEEFLEINVPLALKVPWTSIQRQAQSILFFIIMLGQECSTWYQTVERDSFAKHLYRRWYQLPRDPIPYSTLFKESGNLSTRFIRGKIVLHYLSLMTRMHPITLKSGAHHGLLSYGQLRIELVSLVFSQGLATASCTYLFERHFSTPEDTISMATITFMSQWFSEPLLLPHLPKEILAAVTPLVGIKFPKGDDEIVREAQDALHWMVMYAIETQPEFAHSIWCWYASLTMLQQSADRMIARRASYCMGFALIDSPIENLEWLLESVKAEYSQTAPEEAFVLVCLIVLRCPYPFVETLLQQADGYLHAAAAASQGQGVVRKAGNEVMEEWERLGILCDRQELLVRWWNALLSQTPFVDRGHNSSRERSEKHIST
jgi:hypothetical protein